MQATILDYAAYVIGHSAFNGRGITHLKAQKILYYIRVWGIVSKNETFPEQFKKWKFGPVNQDIYDKYKSFGKNPIFEDMNGRYIIEGPQAEFVDFIIESYAPFDGIALSAMSHREEPWIQTPINDIIPDELIADYYSSHSFAQNFPLDIRNNFYYPILSDLDSAFVFDMNQDMIDGVFVYESFSEYKSTLAAQKKLMTSHFKKLIKKY